jgi:hypothetical protein
MKKILTLFLIIIGILLILSLSIKSCKSEEVCDVLTEKQCRYESTCNPILFDLF